MLMRNERWRRLLGAVAAMLLAAPLVGQAEDEAPQVPAAESVADVDVPLLPLPFIDEFVAAQVPDPFGGLMPGRLMTDAEMSRIYGRGTEVTVESGGDVIFSGDPLATSDSDQISSLTDTSGVTTAIPVIGDNNEVYVNVVINVELNTVTIQDVDGAEVQVNQTLDLGGGIVQALGN